MKQTAHHQPVMLTEAIEMLSVKPDYWYIDATFGRGGHTSEILKHGGLVLALDIDQEAIQFAQDHFSTAINQSKLLIRRANFAEIDAVWRAEASLKELRPQGILFDFGTTSDQLLSPTRGFSFDHDAPLDMRMDDRLGVTAADFLQVLSEKELATVFRNLGGETFAQPIARRIKQLSPVTTTKQLAQLIVKTKPQISGHLHPATKVFQALRMIVNSEVDNLEQAIPKAFKLLQPTGRLVTLAFHEGEDRFVKHFFKSLETKSQIRLLTPKVLTPVSEEVENNPRSRSTKLRAIEKL